jgi:hypothetical protein
MVRQGRLRHRFQEWGGSAAGERGHRKPQLRHRHRVAAQGQHHPVDLLRPQGTAATVHDGGAEGNDLVSQEVLQGHHSAGSRTVETRTKE